MNKKYALYGEEYFGDGVTGLVTIRTGTKKQCIETMKRLEGDGQYSEMFVDLEDEDDEE